MKEKHDCMYCLKYGTLSAEEEKRKHATTQKRVQQKRWLLKTPFISFFIPCSLHHHTFPILTSIRSP